MTVTARLFTALALGAAIIALAGTVVGCDRAAPVADGCVAGPGQVRVGIVVDFGSLGGVSTTCVVVDSRANGAQALAERARQLGVPPPRYASSGLLCGIDGGPATGCGEPTPAGYRYWSYWLGTGSGWTYASVGPAGHRVSENVVEGWHFVNGSDSGSEPPPNGPANSAAILPPVTTPAPPPPPPTAITTSPVPTNSPVPATSPATSPAPATSPVPATSPPTAAAPPQGPTVAGPGPGSNTGGAGPTGPDNANALNGPAPSDGTSAPVGTSPPKGTGGTVNSTEPAPPPATGSVPGAGSEAETAPSAPGTSPSTLLGAVPGPDLTAPALAAPGPTATATSSAPGTTASPVSPDAPTARSPAPRSERALAAGTGLRPTNARTGSTGGGSNRTALAVGVVVLGALVAGGALQARRRSRAM